MTTGGQLAQLTPDQRREVGVVLIREAAQEVRLSALHLGQPPVDRREVGRLLDRPAPGVPWD